MDTSEWGGFFNTHQCFKYCRNGEVKTVVADAKPFTMAEAHYADAKFYLKDAPVEDALHTPNTKQHLKQKKKKSYFRGRRKNHLGVKGFYSSIHYFERVKDFKAST